MQFSFQHTTSKIWFASIVKGREVQTTVMAELDGTAATHKLVSWYSNGTIITVSTIYAGFAQTKKAVLTPSLLPFSPSTTSEYVENFNQALIIPCSQSY